MIESLTYRDMSVLRLTARLGDSVVSVCIGKLSFTDGCELNGFFLSDIAGMIS